MSALIHNLLDYQLIEKGEVKRRIEPIDIHSLTVGHVDILQQLALEKGIQVEVDWQNHYGR